MGFFSTLSNSIDLVTGMAERLHSEMAELLVQDPQRYAPVLRSMAINCNGCPARADCRRLQDRSLHLNAAPQYCLNKPAMDALRRR